MENLNGILSMKKTETLKILYSWVRKQCSTQLEDVGEQPRVREVLNGVWEFL
jgi:hypothetical protein